MQIIIDTVNPKIVVICPPRTPARTFGIPLPRAYMRELAEALDSGGMLVFM